MYHVHHGKASNQRLGSKPLIKQRGKQPLGRGSHGQGSKAKTSFLLSLFQLLSCVRLFVILWIVAHQALLPMEFSRQEYWSGLPFPSPYIHIYLYILASQVVLVVKNLPANAGNIRDIGSIPGSEKSLGGGHGDPLQCSCLETPMDGRAWWATAHGVAKSWTQLSD